MKTKVAQHAQLERRVYLPFWLRFRYCYNIDEVNHDLHGQKRNEKTNTIKQIPASSNASKGMSLLRDIVIESQNWSCEIERRV